MILKHKGIFSCHCADPGCPIHPGSETCENKSEYKVYRIDMEDETGTPMCQGCYDDAMASGLFSDTYTHWN